MANNFLSNFTRKLAEVTLDQFENKRVLSKNVNTQLLTGKFDPSTGDTVDFSRPTDYKSVRTSDGDLTSETASDIITGKASGVVQDYFTVFVDYQEAKQAIEMNRLDTLLDPMSTRIVTDFELDFASFMMKNTALLAGTVGTSADTWDDIAAAGSIMQSSGVPMDDRMCYAVNPFTQRKLASTNRSLGAGGAAGALVKTAVDRAVIDENFAGMRVLTASTLASYTTGAGANRDGTVVGTPVATYVGAKDTMTQVIGVTAFQANLVVAAGETITVTGRNRLNLSTRQPILDENGATILFSGTVTTAVTLDGSGAGNLTVTGPAIFEANGQYNTVSSAIAASDVITLGGAASTIIQPNLFWHKQAFSVGSVPIEKLYSTDTLATTEDGLQMRVSYGSDFLANKQKVRIDFRPAYGVMNPFFAGKGFGAA
jgi:hypothetical protein